MENYHMACSCGRPYNRTCGMNRQPGLLIETDADHYPYGYPQTYLLPTVQSNEITAGVGSNMMVYTPIAQGIVKHEDGDYTFTSLLSTSSTAYSMEGYATAETAQKADTTTKAVTEQDVSGGRTKSLA